MYDTEQQKEWSEMESPHLDVCEVSLYSESGASNWGERMNPSISGAVTRDL